MRVSPVSCALSLACLAPVLAAQAQSSVQAYGLIDVSVGQFQAPGGLKDKTVESGKMSTSYFGFKGTEDLGGGLGAKFAIESFLRANSGKAGRFDGDAFWARSAWVGLSGSAGSLNLGRNTTSLFVSTLLFNPFGDSFGFSPSIRHYFTSGTTTGDTGWSDSLSYTTPSFSGLTAQVQMAGATNGDGGRNVGGHLLYFSGGFAATVAGQKVEKGATTDDTTTSQLGLSYDFGALKLFGQYGKVKNDSKTNDYKLSALGVSVPVGAGKLLLAHGVTQPDTGAKLTTTSFGYDHSLSKRTDLYAVGMSDKKEGLDNGTSFALGLRHRF